MLQNVHHTMCVNNQTLVPLQLQKHHQRVYDITMGIYGDVTFNFGDNIFQVM